MKQNKISHILFKVLIAILSLFTIFMIIGVFQEFQYSFTDRNPFRDSDYIWYLEKEDYEGLLYAIGLDSQPEEKISSEARACRAVAFYYQAAVLYKAYLTAENNAAADKQLQRMQSYAEESAPYEDHLPRILEFLDLSLE